MNDRTTYVLVPGAWHGGWAWQPVAQRLRAAGHRALTLTLPGLDGDGDYRKLALTDAVVHIVNEVVNRGLTDVTLVAHSWGAYPATGAAHRLPGRISSIVYFSALVPTPGKSMVDDEPPERGKANRDLIESAPDHAVMLTWELVRDLLVQDAAEETQRLVHELLVPQPGNYFLDPLDVPSVLPADVSTAYLLCADDRILPRPGTEYARRLNVEPILVPGSHDAMLTHPDEVTKALLSL